MIVQLSVHRGVPVCATVADYAEASARVREFIGTRGASECPRGMGLIAENGIVSAYVSYNGRVWSGRPEDWKCGMVPLFDPL